MTKLLLEPKQNIDFIKNFDGVLLGLKNYSVGYEIEMTIEEIKQFQQMYSNKEVFVVLNKNIMNEELNEVLNLLKQIETIQVKGVLFYDLAVLYLKQKYNLDINLVWNQTHMVTNYNTCNYYYNEGCKYAYLSQEITLNEMLEIISNSKIKTIVKVFGRPTIAHSKRKLLSNYFKHINKEMKKDTYKIKESHLNKEYVVKESNNGATIFEGKLVNGIRPTYELRNKADYLILEEQPENFEKAIEIYQQALNDEIIEEEAINKLKELYPDSTEGFFYTKTIYKVKKNEES